MEYLERNLLRQRSFTERISIRYQKRILGLNIPLLKVAYFMS